MAEDEKCPVCGRQYTWSNQLGVDRRACQKCVAQAEALAKQLGDLGNG
jgi:hypothetical protein